MKKIEFDISKMTPPGIDAKGQFSLFTACNILSILYSFSFIFKYCMEYDNLFSNDGLTRTLREGVMIKDFHVILGTSNVGFYLSAVFMLFYVIYYYSAYRNGSMSIYLMKRLPNPYELHLRAWTLPIITAVFCLVIGFLMTVLYFGLYLIATPSKCLPSEQWHSFWAYYFKFI